MKVNWNIKSQNCTLRCSTRRCWKEQEQVCSRCMGGRGSRRGEWLLEKQRAERVGKRGESRELVLQHLSLTSRPLTGLASWEHIKAVKDAVKVHSLHPLGHHT